MCWHVSITMNKPTSKVHKVQQAAGTGGRVSADLDREDGVGA